MEITNLGFYGLNKPQLQTKPEKHDNKAVANHTDIVSKAGNSAIRSMAMANIHRTMNIRQAGNDYKVEGKYKIIGEQTAEQANDFWKSVGYTDSPYKPNKKAQIIELTQDTKFVRTYDGKNSGMYGSWVMKYDDIKGLKPEEIAVVGDQIFTDVLGGNRCKMFTILIEPIAEKDIWLTKVKRPIEIFIKKKYLKKINKGGDMD